MNLSRTAEVKRTTGETDISLTIDLDGTGTSTISTAVPFLDHMLDALCRHGRINATIAATGDSAMDPHHTVEDVGIALGGAFREALGERRGIERYAHSYAPLDEALARVVIDISGRPYFEMHGHLPEPIIGTDFATSLVEEFWRSFAMNAGWSMHIDVLRARNSHHAAEAIFKAAAIAIRSAIRVSGPVDAVPSTKGMLA